MQREENDKKSRRGNPQEGWQITKAQLEGAGLSLPPGVVLEQWLILPSLGPSLIVLMFMSNCLPQSQA